MAYDPTKNRAARNLDGKKNKLTFQDLRNLDQSGEFVKGLRAGASHLTSAAAGLQGIGNALIGNEKGVARAREEGKQASIESQIVGPSVKRIEEIDSISSFRGYFNQFDYDPSESNSE